MAIERLPMSAGEIVGHRVWEVHLLDGVPTLRSWAINCFWPPGEVVSDVSYTNEQCHGGIEDYNQRGVWAFKTRDLLHEDFRRYCLARGLVYGTCYMWGTVIEHELGYRAQHARVLALELKHDGTGKESWSYGEPVATCDIDLDFLRKRYGVGDGQCEKGTDRSVA